MIPLKLTIEGIYSYQERQTIDFTDLTGAGLFGIFGQVGSGKSSILEAISYALYGETERLNARDKRTYNMMNLKSNRSFVAFDFVNFENERFRATREFKRNSKNFEDVKTPVAVFYIWKNNEWEPLEHTDAEKIVGLSYHNFKRTIIIPQGQFREFLELGGKERTTMMMEIFNLHRYDLQDKTATLEKKNQSELDVLEGKLSGFEKVTKEQIENLEENAGRQKEELERLQKDFSIATESYQQLKFVKEEFGVLSQKKRELKEKQSQKSKYDEKEKELQQYEMIYKAFHQLLIEKEKNEKELSVLHPAEEKKKKTLQYLKKQKEEITHSLEKLKPIFDQLPLKKKEEDDLESIAQIKGFNEEINALQTRIAKGEKTVEESEKKINLIQNEIEQLELGTEKLKEKRINPEILLNAGAWYNQQKSLEEKRKEKENNIGELNNKLSLIDESLNSQKINSSSFEQDFQNKYRHLEDEKKALEVALNQYRVQQQLAEYSHELHDGEPCPLCGSPKHPHVAEIEDVTEQIRNTENKIREKEAELKKLNKQETEIKLLLNDRKQTEELLTNRNEELKTVTSAIIDHRELFAWDDFKPDNPEVFEEKKSATIQLEKEIELKNKSLTAANKNLRTEQENLKKYQIKIEELQRKGSQKKGQIQQNRDQLKVLKYDDCTETTKENILTQLESLRKSNIELEQSFTNLTSRYNNLSPEIAGLESTLNALSERIEKLAEEGKNLNGKIQSSLNEHHLQTLQEVNDILSIELNVTVLRKEIENFKVIFSTLQNSISELEKKLAGKNFDETQFRELEDSLKKLTEELNTRTENWNVTNAEIRRLSDELKEKEILQQQQNKLQKRADNLKIMTNLFKGSGFVQYVSSVYLRQLCDHANIRFHRMTRNQLSLQLNDSNDFEVIDYLNGGKRRSVKTLSGGQSFQASLSMALALAESVQSDAKADKNFFFIDEGFGTQDTESVNIVFDTLMQLQKENRIVGIISHVEELKERIPVALKITKDDERGSLIAYYE